MPKGRGFDSSALRHHQQVMKMKQAAKRNPVARALRVLRHKVRPSAKVYRRRPKNDL
jgi:hypothetical protein